MRTKFFLALILFSLASLSFASVFKSNVIASYYGEKFHGHKTASGETFDMHAMTCAHKTLSFGTLLRVTNLSNNKSVVVRVNDRGPFVKDREIDVSKAAAEKLDMLKTGTARVKIEIIDKNDPVAGIEKVPAKPEESSSAYWDVQVGAFSDHDNANKLAQSLLNDGFENVYFQKTEIVTRVVLKKIPESKLRQVEDKLRSAGISDFVVKKAM
ncbi:MAG: septal ring lytic transglycosylase RlpA family protein [Treponema sp.]|nr:septal ring lytic transglycosylase RlpA family protein [Treponema sp.]